MAEIQATYQDILFEKDDGVATITINRPETLNAFTPATLREMIDAFDRIRDDGDVGVAVITGAGERAFCSGGDMRWEQQGGIKDLQQDNVMLALYEAMRNCLKPVIARVNGYAIGGGNHLAYHCDFSIAADHAVFGQNGPRVGSPAQGSIVSYLVRVAGAKRARELWMLCRRYSAQQMYEWGLVNAVVPMAELDAEVRRWCDELLALSPTVLKIVKKSFDDEWAPLRERQDGADFLEEINPAFFESGEQLEGANAFMEKRRPDFSPWR